MIVGEILLSYDSHACEFWVWVWGLNFNPTKSFIRIYFLILVPVWYVNVKIKAKGIHVPIGLRNMSKFGLLEVNSIFYG
jgi:hypothetical protein